jgi:hypothetical protein
VLLAARIVVSIFNVSDYSPHIFNAPNDFGFQYYAYSFLFSYLYHCFCFFDTDVEPCFFNSLIQSFVHFRNSSVCSFRNVYVISIFCLLH